MEIASTTAANSGPPPGTHAPAAIPNQSLGADDFFKLLTVQLSNQNPLEPLKDTDFIAQMSNFSSLEQMKQLNGAFSRFSDEQRIVNAQNFLGKTVTYLRPSGDEASLTVDSLTLEDGHILLHGGDRSVRATQVTGSFLPSTDS